MVLMQLKGFWQICYLYGNPISDDGIRLQAQLRIMSDNHENKRVFFVGSSQTREDFDVDHLNSLFGEKSVEFFNLGISGAAQPIEMFMIEDSLLKKKPDVIVYMPFVGSFYGSYGFAKMKYYFSPKVLPYMFDYLGIKEIFDHRYAFIDSFLSEFSLFFKYKNSLKRISVALLSSYLWGEEKAAPEKFGYHKNKDPIYFKNEIKKSKGKRYDENRYSMLNENLFVLFADNIISNEITFIVVDAPVHPLIKETYKNDIDIEYSSFLLKQSKEIGFVFLEKNTLPKFSKEDFIDFTHLNKQGRDKMTAFIAKYFEQVEWR